MLELVFLICFIIIITLIVKYYRALNRVANIAMEDSEVQNLTFRNEQLTNIILMRDFEFALTLITGSYKKKIKSLRLTKEMNKARKYLLWQYPFALTMFIIPALSKLIE